MREEARVLKHVADTAPLGGQRIRGRGVKEYEVLESQAPRVRLE
jgi:hypothetical protein